MTQELSIIGAVGAEVAPSALPLLATDARVRAVSVDSDMKRSSDSRDSYTCGDRSCPNRPTNTYENTSRVTLADDLRDSHGDHLDGSGVGIAVIDSGIASDRDFSSVPVRSTFVTSDPSVDDVYGHGTHVAGILAGNGSGDPDMRGVAPDAKLLSLRVSDADGMARESDVVAAMQWVLENQSAYNIRVVNLSLNSGTEVSYDESPLDAACEILWFNNIVVITSAGNKPADGSYNTINAAPANDPFVITVGASDEQGTSSTGDDFIAPFSAFGTTDANVAKPDVIAPGVAIWSVLSRSSNWKATHPQLVSPDGQYIKLSGTSMSAPVVAGTVALMLQKSPWLNADQVKYRITHPTSTIKAEDGTGNAYPYLDAYNAATKTGSNTSNTGLKASDLLTTGEDPIDSSVMWRSVTWNSVLWRSVMWNSVMWRSVMWHSVMWRSTYMSPVDWESSAKPPAARVHHMSRSPRH